MNYLKENTTGIDTPIKGLQTYLYDSLVCDWSLDRFDAYGRVYKNKRDSKIVPEYYENNREYKEVLLDDTRDGIMFFSPSDITNAYGDLLIQECDIIFTFNLKSLSYSNEREDEEVRQRVLFLLNSYPRKQEVKQIITGLKNVYSDYNGVQEYFYDMQDFHHFKITLELRFNNNNCK